MASNGNGDRSDIEARKIQDGVNAFLQGMAPVSLALVRLDEPTADEVEPGFRGSGLLVEHNGFLMVVSCAHVVRRGEWAVEIRTEASPAISEEQVYETPLPERRTPLRPLPPPQTIDNWDFAWMPFEAGNGTRVIGSLRSYIGPVDRRPVAGEAYGFISWNRDTVYPANVIERSPSHEVGMAFIGSDASGMYRFRLDGKHKGHPFYRGASGAPIADPDGVVVALVANGEEAEDDIIQGVPFADAMAVALKP